MDEKFEILKHPNVALTADGEGKPYLHGEVREAVATTNAYRKSFRSSHI